MPLYLILNVHNSTQPIQIPSPANTHILLERQFTVHHSHTLLTMLWAKKWISEKLHVCLPQKCNDILCGKYIWMVRKDCTNYTVIKNLKVPLCHQRILLWVLLWILIKALRGKISSLSCHAAHILSISHKGHDDMYIWCFIICKESILHEC